MKPRCRIPVALPTALIVSIAGCYSYVPADPGRVPPRSDVRAVVTPDQAARLDPLLVQGERVVEGELLENGATDLLLLVPVSSDVRGARVETLHQRIRLSNADVVQLELRELDRTRTGLLIAGGAALVAGVLIRQLTGDSGGQTGGPGPNPPENRVPVGPRLRY